MSHIFHSPSVDTSTTQQSSSNKQQVAVNLRKVLETTYHCDGSLPSSLSEHILTTYGDNSVPSNNVTNHSIYSDMNEHDYGENEIEKKIIKKVLNDDNIPAADKERIARSILQGNFEIQATNASSVGSGLSLNESFRFSGKIANKQNRQVIAHGKDNNTKQLRLLSLNRHKLPKPHFLEVITHSTPIPIVSPKKLHREKVLLLRNSISLGKLRPGTAEELRRAKEDVYYSDYEKQQQQSMNKQSSFLTENHQQQQQFQQSSSFRPVLMTDLDRPKSSTRSATVYRDPNPTYRERYSKLLSEDRE
jgi:hypothetical protein